MCVGLSPMHKVCAITIKYTLCITSTVPAHNTCFTLCIASVLLWSVHDVSMYNVEWSVYIDDVCMSLFVIVLVTRDHLCILLSLLGRIQLTLVLPRSHPLCPGDHFSVEPALPTQQTGTFYWGGQNDCCRVCPGTDGIYSWWCDMLWVGGCEGCAPGVSAVHMV